MECPFGVQDDLERFVVDPNKLGGVFGFVTRARDHNCERLARITDDLGGERRLEESLHALVGEHPHRNSNGVGQVGGGDHIDDARGRARGAYIDGGNSGVGFAAANNRGVDGSR